MYNALDILGVIEDMVKQHHHHYWIIAVGLVLISLLIWLGLMVEFRLDDSFITYRYAHNVTRGWGLVYNPDEAILSTTAPLYALLLAVLSYLITDFHILGGLLGAVCIGLGGSVIVFLLPRRMTLLLRTWGGLLYVLSTPLWLALGMETPLWILLVLATVLGLRHDYFWQAGLLIGLAILTRPDAALPGLLLGLVALGVTINALGTQRYWWRPVVSYSIAALVPIAVFAIWALITYGSPFPATLSAKRVQALLGITGFGVFVDTWGGLQMIVQSLLMQSGLYLLFAPLMLFGLSKKLASRVWVIVAWGVLHFLAYVLMGVAPYRWYYVPLLPGVILLAVYGLEQVSALLNRYNRLLARYAVAGIALLPIAAQITSFTQIAAYFEHGGERQTMLPIVDWQAYREAGEWLNAHTPPDALIGVAEVGQLGFYADRPMTDYLGLLQPEVAALLQRDDLYSWLVEYAPDYLVFQRFGGNVGLALYNYFIEYDPWFVANYREVAKFDDPRYVLGPVVIYERILPIHSPLELTIALADFGPVRLTGAAVDIQGETARLRLDWQVTGDLPPDLHIGVSVFNTDEAVKFDGDYHTQHWMGKFSTWHTLVFSEALAVGTYPLEVSIGLINGEYVPRTISELTIPIEATWE